MLDEQVDHGRRKRASISDVALEAGVSRAAVSKVIRNAYGVSPAMRLRVETAIDRLNYRPRVAARAMRGQSFTIGFEIPQLGNDFFTQIILGASAQLAGSGYQLIIAPALDEVSGTPVLDALVDRQVDGIIAISPQLKPESLEQVAELIPVVLLGRHDQSLEYDTVTNDDAAGANLVMDHLLGLGHTRIAHLTVNSANVRERARAPHNIRLAEYEERMIRAGLVPELVYTAPFEPDAYDAALALLESSDPPTAIFAGNDTLAIGALRAVADAGLDAGSVAVVGYDDIDLARHPLISLTTVNQFGVEMGAAAIELLMERIRDGRRSPTHHQVTPELRVRRSSQGIPPPTG